jgi:NAD(P)-dependent dehydrogenase (short-subunit alcohol dehydrogenase family)
VALSLSNLGHSVVVTARSKDELDDLAGQMPGRALVVAGDITDGAFVDELFSRAEAELGAVEVLVANAGVASSNPIHRVTDEDWQLLMDVNLTAPFRCMRRAVPSMLGAGFGRIVVIASVASKRGDPYIAAYTAAKHGVLGLVRATAAELATKGITVNAVCPAFVDTPMTDGTVANISARTGRSEEQARQALERMQPIGRLITVQEVADVVTFLLDAPGVTGQGWNVDGGAVQS